MKDPFTLAADILQNEIETQTRIQMFNSIDLYGNSVREKMGEDSFHLENKSGTGDITIYHVFPGIDLVYNDMHMAYCNKDEETVSNVLEINYCKEGRSECLFGEHKYCYMAAGDLTFCSLQENHRAEFPTSHYHGITVTIDFSGISEEMEKVLKLLCVDLARIKEISEVREFTLIRANETIEHIFSELYTVPEKIRGGYIRVKVLELLLVLTEINPAEDRSEAVQFSKTQIESIKQIHDFLTEHFNEHYTIEELSERFAISPTAMKKCFKGVYGDSIYSYIKRYRLQVAEQLLKESSLTIAEIAFRVGYLNPNKFTTAFCAAYGMPPTSYRKKV